VLIPSPRHTAIDLEVWARLEQTDQVLAGSEHLARREEAALAELQRFAGLDGTCFVAVSWGKDSVVVAHLAVRAGLRVPFVWVRYDPSHNPDCPAVRDVFLRRFPVDYQEIVVTDTCLPAGVGWRDLTWEQDCRLFFREADELGRRILGLRARESGRRRRRARRFGCSSPSSCAPIVWWDAALVFAYLRKYDLPVHPAYAMSEGGFWDRARIRVDGIGDERGTGCGRGQWERRYYPEVPRCT